MEIMDFRKQMKVSASDEELNELVYLFLRCNAGVIKDKKDFYKICALDPANKGEVSIDDLLALKKQLVFDNLFASGKNPYEAASSEKKDMVVSENAHVLSLMNSKTGFVLSGSGILDNDDSAMLEHEFVLSVKAEDFVSVLKAVYDSTIVRELTSVRIIVPPLALISRGYKDSIKIKCSSEELEYTMKMLESLERVYKQKCMAPSDLYGRATKWYGYNEINVETKKKGNDIVFEYLLDSIEQIVLEAIQTGEVPTVLGEDANEYYNRMASSGQKYEALQRILNLNGEKLQPLVFNRIKDNMSKDGMDISDIYSVKEVKEKVDSLYGKVSYEMEFEQLAEGKVIPEVVEEKKEETVVENGEFQFVIPDFLKNPNRERVEGGISIPTPVKVNMPSTRRVLTPSELERENGNSSIRRLEPIEIKIPDFLKKENLDKIDTEPKKVTGGKKSKFKVIQVLHDAVSRLINELVSDEYGDEYALTPEEKIMEQEAIASLATPAVEATPVVDAALVEEVVENLLEPVAPVVEEVTPVVDATVVEELAPEVEKVVENLLEPVAPVVEEVQEVAPQISEEERLDQMLAAVLDDNSVQPVVEEPVQEVAPVEEMQPQEVVQVVEEVAPEVAPVEEVAQVTPEVIPEEVAQVTEIVAPVEVAPVMEAVVEQPVVETVQPQVAVDSQIVEQVVETPVESEELTPVEIQNVVQADAQMTQMSGADYVVKYTPYMDNVALLNANLNGSEKTILQYFEENSLTERINPTDTIRLHPEIGGEITAKEFISKYLVDFLQKNSQYDLNYVINLYVEAIIQEVQETQTEEKTKKRTLFGLLGK